MANNKFTSQTKYEFDLDSALSKIRFDFDTNVGTNPTNSVLGLDSDSVGFVLLDQSLITGAGGNLKTSTTNNDLNVKTYVFEKTVDPSVVGCENCGPSAKYFPAGVATSASGSVLKGDITDPDVLPVINKEVIAEFEIEPEAYHSFEIDLIGNRRICNDSGKCFTEDLKVSKQEIDKGATGDPNKISWLARTIYTGANSESNKTRLRELATNKNNALSGIPIKNQPITVGTTSTYNPLNAGPPSTPSEKMSDIASTALSAIDYSCCKCCDIVNTPGLTLAQKVALCEETNVYNVSAQEQLEGANNFFTYCNTASNLDYVPWNDLAKTNVSICSILLSKKEQYGYYPSPDIPQCLNGIYGDFNTFAFNRQTITGGSTNFRESLETIEFDSSLTPLMFGPDPSDDMETQLDSCGDWDVDLGCDCTQSPGHPNWCDCCSSGGRVNCCSGDSGPDGGGGGGGSTGEGQNAVRHCGDIFDINTSTFVIQDSYLLGRCKNYPMDGDPNSGDIDLVDSNTKHVYQFQSDWCAIIPNSPSTPTLQNDTSNASSVQNYCYLTVNDFVTSPFDASKQNILGLFEDVPWLTMGGHFYSHEKLRDFVYKQTGTIHFSTSVNSNFLSYKPFIYGTRQNNFTTDGFNTIYHIENIRANGKEYKLDYSHKPTAPAFYKSGAAHLSIGFGYNSNVNISEPGSGNDAYPYVKRYTFHNLKNEGGFHSEYRTNESRISFSPSSTDPGIIISQAAIKNTLDRTTTNNILETDYAITNKTYSISSSVVEPQLEIFGPQNFSDDDFSGIWDADRLYATDDSLIVLRNGGVYCIDHTAGTTGKNYCVTPWDTTNTTVVATTTDNSPASLSKAFGNVGTIQSVHGVSSPLVAVDIDSTGVLGNSIVCWQGNLAAASGIDDFTVVGDCFGKRLNTPQSIGVGEGFIVIKNFNGNVQAWGDPGTNNQHFPTPAIENLIVNPGFIGMKCGRNHCVLLENSTGTLKVHAWGNNDFKQIEVPTFPTGTQISPNADFDDVVSCGDDHTCVVLSNNTIVCWGNNGSGQCSGTDASGNPITSSFKTSNAPVQINGVTLSANKVRCSSSASFSFNTNTESIINGVWGFTPTISSGTKASDVASMFGTSVIMRNKKIDPMINNETILSGDTKIKWPLTNQLDKYVPVGRQSFKLVPNTDPELDGTPNTGRTVEGTPNYQQWLQFSNIYYNNVSPTDSVIISGIRRTYDRMHQVISYKHYLINNSIPQPFSFITDARDFGTGGSFENFRFEAKFLDDTTLEISDNTTQGTTRLFNKSNALHSVTGQTPAKVLNDILATITPTINGFVDNVAFGVNGDPLDNRLNSTTNSIHMIVNAYVGTVAGSTLTIDKTKEVLEHGTVINSFQKSGSVGSTNFKITLKLDKPFTRYTEPGSTLTPPNLNGTVKYFLVFKIKKNIKGFTDSIVYDRTSVLSRREGFYKFQPYSGYNMRINAGDQIDEGLGSTRVFQPTSDLIRRENFLYKTDTRLFSINSSRFSTPDYASYDANAYVKKIVQTSDEIVIPMRGLQYAFYKKKQGLDTGVLAEVDDYPIMRTIRKNDGKFYIQILAGAFPYYHPLVHEPILKKLGIQGNYDLEWRNQICRKSSQWFNYVATTKWTCVVKHTQLSSNIGDWAAALPPTSSGGGTESKPIVVGRSPSTAEITTPIVSGGSGIKPDARESVTRFPATIQIQLEAD